MSVLASAAHNWGIRDIDVETVYAASLKNELGWQNRPIGVGKADVKTFLDRGYVPYIEKAPAFSGSTADGSIFSASHTLEYSFSAYAVAQFARSLGKTDDYEKLMEYSRGWQKLYDAETHFIRPRTLAGEFIADFDPKKPWVGFQEGNAWQYTFYVPHDIPGLASRMGERTFQERLASVFQEAEKTKFGGGEKVDAFAGLQNVYNHGNQPSLHIAWLFNAAQQPWLTQHWIRRICDVFYGTNRIHGYGYGQDEDQGQLGAWFVLAAMGLFDIQGGTAPDPQFQLASPLFDEVRIQLHPRHHAGQAFTIKSKGDATGLRYIQSARLNGQEHPRASIPWKAVATGATLSLELGPEPNQSWGVGQ
jgi:predicted alpha-1,2-mannosidase